MVGYQEIASDPSYTDQAVVMTYPLIGNYGITDDDFEGKNPSIGAFIVYDYNDKPSNFRYTKTLSELLEENGIPAISGIDTRRLTRSIRAFGSRRGIITDISTPAEKAIEIIKYTPVPHDAVARVSCKKRWYSRTANPQFNVVAIDCGIKLGIVRSLNRLACNVTVVPFDTTAEEIEFDSYIPYFYSTYAEENESVVSDKEKIIVLGSGPIRIGQGVEFDYSTVHAVRTIKSCGHEAIVINNNPETVSTDDTAADKLYFEPLTPEDVLNIVHLEKPVGVIATLGGQTAVNLAQPLADKGVRIIGTNCDAIEKAENRDAFNEVILSLGIPNPKGEAVTDIESGVAAERMPFILLRQKSRFSIF